MHEDAYERAVFAREITREEFRVYRAYWTDELLHDIKVANSLQAERIRITRSLIKRQIRRMLERERRRIERKATRSRAA